jgi:hypothetical protein
MLYSTNLIQTDVHTHKQTHLPKNSTTVLVDPFNVMAVLVAVAMSARMEYCRIWELGNGNAMVTDREP